MNICSTKGNGKSVHDKLHKEMADLTIDIITTLDQIMHAFVIDGFFECACSSNGFCSTFKSGMNHQANMSRE